MLRNRRLTLYFAALNIPDEEAAAAAAAITAAAAAPPTKGAKGSDAAAASPPPTKCIIEALPIDMAEVDRMRNELRAYTRDAEKRIRESVAAAAAAGWMPPGQVWGIAKSKSEEIF